MAEPTTDFSAISSFVLGSCHAPDAVRTWAAWLLLDTLGVCAAAAPMEAGRLGRETAFRLFGAGSGADRGAMLFDGRPASLAGVAFAAGTQTDNLDAHDGYNPVKGHIGCAVVPALCALAQKLPDLSGPKALAAMITGYEIAGRAGLALHATVSDYHTSGAWNALGVAALAARLRGQDADTLREALGIAEYHGPRSQMMREIATPTMLHDGSGMGAFVGVSAAIMAEMGFTGAPAITIERADAAPFWADLGQNWLTAQQYVKPYPICRWAHAPIDAAAHLQAKHGFDHSEITEVRIHSFHNALALWSDTPTTTSQAQYSLAFSVGAHLVHGQIGLGQISGAALGDPDIARLVAATVLDHDPEAESRFPNTREARVTITLNDGRVLASDLMDASGGPQAPWGEAEITAKFRRLAGPTLGEARTEAMIASALSLTEPDSRFADLGALLTEPV